MKAARTGAKVLMLDEPTSAISEREVEGLYRIVRRLRDHGVAMVYTTHKMAEIRAIADRVVVLRDGGLILDKTIEDVSDDDIVTAMIGRELDALFPQRPQPGTEPVLEVSGLQVEGASGPVSFTVKAGEIVGLAGLVGAGRTELLEAIFGARRTTAGTVTVRGRAVARNQPAAAIVAGMAMVPEDRKLAGAVLSMSVLDNATLPRMGAFSLAGWLRGKARSAAVSEAMSSVRLRSRGLGQEVGTLSGGNQQKVVLARWLTENVNVLLLDEPTRGVDVGARSEIYRIITDLAANGMAVLMASSDMPEVVGLSHRAFVMRAGMLVGELDRDSLDHPAVQESVFRLATALDAAPPARHPNPIRRPHRDDQTRRRGHRVFAYAQRGLTGHRRAGAAVLPRMVRGHGAALRDGAGDGARHRLFQLPQRAIRHGGQPRHDPGGGRPVRVDRARPDPGDPHRRHRPVGRQRDRGVGDGRCRDRQGQSRPGVDDRAGRHVRRAVRGMHQRRAGVTAQTCRRSSRRWAR